jgi:REP element-mobilizing transposase RayT
VARRPRDNQPNGIYHVFARGNNRERIYRDDQDRRLYLNRLAKTADRSGWRALGYCLMDNHLHALIETPHANLSAGMQYLQGGYAQVFNLRHRRVGHLFQGRYGAVSMRTDTQVCAAAAYIARNPVAAGLCRTAADWPWSSFRAVAEGKSPGWIDGERLLGFFGSQIQLARERYVEMSELDPYDPLG